MDALRDIIDAIRERFGSSGDADDDEHGGIRFDIKRWWPLLLYFSLLGICFAVFIRLGFLAILMALILTVLVGLFSWLVTPTFRKESMSGSKGFGTYVAYILLSVGICFIIGLILYIITLPIIH